MNVQRMTISVGSLLLWMGSSTSMPTSISMQAIRILERHADFVLEYYERYKSEEQTKPADLGEMF